MKCRFAGTLRYGTAPLEEDAHENCEDQESEEDVQVELSEHVDGSEKVSHTLPFPVESFLSVSTSFALLR